MTKVLVLYYSSYGHIEKMAYAGETPWHGLGKKVSPDLTPQEMLVEAGLLHLDDFTVVRGDISRGSEQVRLAQAAPRHLRRVIGETEMGPHKIEGAVSVGLNVTGRDTVDLLLENDARKERGHDGGGAAPPVFRHDVQKARIVKLHAGLETADLSHL